MIPKRWYASPKHQLYLQESYCYDNALDLVSSNLYFNMKLKTSILQGLEVLSHIKHHLIFAH